MDTLILFLYILIMISLNITIFILLKKAKLNLMISGIMMLLLAPVFGYSSYALFHYFYDWNSGGTGEGAAYGGAILGLITLANGILILVIGMINWGIKLLVKNNQK